jgi:hypothetical protein
MRLTLIVMLLLIVNACSPSQTEVEVVEGLNWVVTYGSAGYDSGEALALDGAGGVVVVGTVEGAVAGADSGADDAFVARIGADGDERWALQFGSDDFDGAFGVARDLVGGFYVVGETTGELAGEGSGLGGSDAFIARYTASGTRSWILQFGTTADDQAMAVAVAPNGDVYVAGRTSGTFDGQTAVGGETDLFVTRFTADGAREWVLQLGTDGFDTGPLLAIDAEGDVVVGGWYQPPVGGAVQGPRSGYLAKVAPTGELVWEITFDSGSDDYAYAMTTDGTDIIVVGDTAGTFAAGGPGGDPGTTDVFVARFDADGNDPRFLQLGTTGSDSARGVAVAADGAVILTARTTGGFDGQAVLGGSDVVLMAIDPLTGERRWLETFASEGDDVPAGLVLGADGAVYVVGSTSGSLEGAEYVGELDLFVLKFVPFAP